CVRMRTETRAAPARRDRINVRTCVIATVQARAQGNSARQVAGAVSAISRRYQPDNAHRVEELRTDADTRAWPMGCTDRIKQPANTETTYDEAQRDHRERNARARSGRRISDLRRHHQRAGSRLHLQCQSHPASRSQRNRQGDGPRRGGERARNDQGWEESEIRLQQCRRRVAGTPRPHRRLNALTQVMLAAWRCVHFSIYRNAWLSGSALAAFSSGATAS